MLVGPDISPLETNAEGKVRSRRTFPLKSSVTWPVIVGVVPPEPASMTRIRPAGPIAMPRGLSSPVATTSTVTAGVAVATAINAETANARAIPNGEDDFEGVVVAGTPRSIVLPFVDVIRVFRRGESRDVGPSCTGTTTVADESLSDRFSDGTSLGPGEGDRFGRVLSSSVHFQA